MVESGRRLSGIPELPGSGTPLPLSIQGRLRRKYFRGGSAEAARADLVRDIYQCFFYLGLPRVPVDGHHTAWEYDYACLLAYDSSEEGNLQNGWREIKEEVKTGLWRRASIYVMVL